MNRSFIKWLSAVVLTIAAFGAHAQVPVGAQIAVDSATNNRVNGIDSGKNTLRAIVTNAQGQPLAGVALNWRDDPKYTASPLSGTVVTNAAGVAELTYGANGPSGRLVITCMPAPDTAVCAVFTILGSSAGNQNTTANQGQPLSAVVLPNSGNSRLTLVSGSNQTGAPGVALAQPLVARMVAVTGGAPVPNQPVEWQTYDAQGTASASVFQNTVTDANGLTQVSFVPPNANAGRRVTAAFPGTGGSSGPSGDALYVINVQTPALNCAPSVAPTNAVVGQAFSINGNCTINGVPATTGTETWTFPPASGVTPATQNRVLPAAALTTSITAAGTYTLNVTFTSGTTTSSAFALNVTVSPLPKVACAPTVSPASPVTGKPFTISGNCKINGTDASAGTESWTIPAIGAQSSVNVNRVLPATPIQRVISTPGRYLLSLQFTSPSGNSPVAELLVTVAQDPETAVPTAPDIRTAQSSIAAVSSSAVQGIRTQFGLLQRRFQNIRSGGASGFVSDIGLNASVNGRALPLPGASSTAADGKQGEKGQSSSSSVTSTVASSEEVEGTRTGRWGAYMMGGIDVQKLKGEGGVNIGTNGLAAGADYRVSRSVVFGGAVGYMKSDTDFVSSTSGQAAEGLSLTLYGSFEPSPAWFVDVGVSSSRNSFDMRRATAAGGIALANTKGTGTGLTVSAGYAFKRDRWLVTPYGRIDALRVTVSEFQETGDTPMVMGEQALKSSIATAGATAQYVFNTGYGVVVPQARLELQRQTQNSVRSVTAQLVGSNVQVVVDPGLGIDKSFGQFGLGISAQLRRGISLFVDYEQGFGKSNTSEYRAGTGLKVEF